MDRVVHERCIKTERQILGRYWYKGKMLCCVLEKPFKNNLNNISAIPEGLYKVVRRYSEKHKEHFHITGVPNRDLILIHVANYVEQLEGCQGVGQYFTFLDKNATIDVTNSRNTLQMLLHELPKEFELEVKDITDK